MAILIKLIMAVLLGVLMILSAMLLTVAATFFIGFISEMLGFTNLAELMFKAQKITWERTKRWFFRYKREKND